jgi:hypothetical protein
VKCGLQGNDNIILGAQTGRRSDAGLVSGYMAAEGSPAAFFRSMRRVRQGRS